MLNGGEKMGDMKKKLTVQKEKMEGAVKEKAGKVTGNKKLELKGKAQGFAASIKEKIPTIKK